MSVKAKAATPKAKERTVLTVDKIAALHRVIEVVPKATAQCAGGDGPSQQPPHRESAVST